MIARRLHHSRELGQPFDFLTWFEYATTASNAFEELVGRLRASDEWAFVEREVDIRLTRDPSAAIVSVSSATSSRSPATGAAGAIDVGAAAEK